MEKATGQGPRATNVCGLPIAVIKDSNLVVPHKMQGRHVLLQLKHKALSPMAKVVLSTMGASDDVFVAKIVSLVATSSETTLAS